GLPEVAEARTLLDYVPKDQDEKRGILETASLFVPPEIVPGPPRSDDARRAAPARLAEEAGRATGPRGDAARQLRAAIEGVLARSGANTLATLERELVGSLPDQIRAPPKTSRRRSRDRCSHRTDARGSRCCRATTSRTGAPSSASSRPCAP